jgi:hypothetical protein
MPLLTRLRYSLLLAIVLTAMASMAIMLASADSIDLLASSATEYAFSLGLFGLSFVLAFAIAPFVAQRLPFHRDQQ